KDPAYRGLLEELLKIDLNYRWSHKPGAGKPWVLEDYLARWPDFGPLDKISEDVIGAEYWVRQRHGDRPSQQAYVARFPRHGAKLLATLRRLDAELSAEYAPSIASPAAQRPAAPSPQQPTAASPRISTATFADALRRHSVLTPVQLDDVAKNLQARYGEPRSLAKEL